MLHSAPPSSLPYSTPLAPLPPPISADELLDSIGLLEHKAEIQELTGKTWDVHSLSFIEKEDLGETTMSVVEKKKFLAAVARATEASKTVAAAAAVALVTGSGTLENS